MHLTPDLLRSVYAMLTELEPFHSWSLPDAEDIRFRVLKTRRMYGDCFREKGGRWNIRLTVPRHPRLAGVIATMAHEMIHVHLREVACHRDSHHHGPAFQAYARQVCEAFPEFDPITF
jgi:hypothetical protein